MIAIRNENGWSVSLFDSTPGEGPAICPQYFADRRSAEERAEELNKTLSDSVRKTGAHYGIRPARPPRKASSSPAHPRDRHRYDGRWRTGR